MPTEAPLSPSEDKRPVVWTKVLFLIYLHVGGVLGLYYLVADFAFKKLAYFMLMILMGSHGTGVGAHRLWAHRSFKAKLPLRIYLAFCFTANLQLDIYNWVRDHRLHHKYSDTDLDPHDASRGFWYSHMGWLCYKKAPKLVKKGHELDLSDLMEDPVVRFQRKYYWFLVPIVTFGVPLIVPLYCWGEDPLVSFYLYDIFRCCATLNGTCLVNSAAHLYGNKPYDKDMLPRQNNLVSILTAGDGWHNFHHVFPWDYRSDVVGNYRRNWHNLFIDGMAKLGLAYDLKRASKEMIEKRARRTGDGSFEDIKKPEENVWGWGDKDMKDEDAKFAKIEYQRMSVGS